MRTIIAGTRTISDFVLVYEVILSCPWARDITEVVSGAHPDDVERFRLRLRKGNPDIFGAIWASSMNIPVKFFPADWNRYGKSAGPIRNGEMAFYGNSLILVWDGKSRGSGDMLHQAMLVGYPRENIFQFFVKEQ